MESPDRPIMDSRDDEHQIVSGGLSAREDDADEARRVELHHETLYDQNEDLAGEKTRLDTGKNIDNSTYTGLENLSETDDLAPRDEQEGDEADEFIKRAEAELKKNKREAA